MARSARVGSAPAPWRTRVAAPVASIPGSAGGAAWTASAPRQRYVSRPHWLQRAASARSDPASASGTVSMKPATASATNPVTTRGQCAVAAGEHSSASHNRRVGPGASRSAGCPRWHLSGSRRGPHPHRECAGGVAPRPHTTECQETPSRPARRTAREPGSGRLAADGQRGAPGARQPACARGAGCASWHLPARSLSALSAAPRTVARSPRVRRARPGCAAGHRPPARSRRSPAPAPRVRRA